MSDHLLHLLTILRTPHSLRDECELRKARLAAKRLRMPTTDRYARAE
jgi:hypothetical protein